MVELKNVSVTYASGVDALNNVSLRINDGDFAFVVDSSGAGKSTMIKLLLKEIDATSGVVTVNGYNLNKLKKNKIPEFRRTLGFVFQDFRLIPSMTVYENIAFVLRVIDAPIKFIRKRVPYVIGLVGLQAKADSYPDELSGGEMQRVAIARALVNDPQLIIADEPTGNIDPELSYEIVELLKSINDQGTTILMVTHEHDLVRHFGGRIISITDGEIVYDEVVMGAEEMEGIDTAEYENFDPDMYSEEAAVDTTEFDSRDMISEMDNDQLIEVISGRETVSAVTESSADDDYDEQQLYSEYDNEEEYYEEYEETEEVSESEADFVEENQEYSDEDAEYEYVDEDVEYEYVDEDEEYEYVDEDEEFEYEYIEEEEVQESADPDEIIAAITENSRSFTGGAEQ